MNINTFSHEQLIDNPFYRSLVEEVEYLKETNKNLQLTVNLYELKISSLQSHIDIYEKKSEINIKAIKINFKKEYEGIIDNLNKTILNLQNDINILNSNKIESSIEDNELFKQLKVQNEFLDISNKENIDKYRNLVYEIDDKINVALDKQKIYYNDIVSKKEEELNTLRNKIDKEDIHLKEKNIEKNIQLPENLFDVVFYRYNKTDPKYKEYIYNDKKNNTLHLKCCNIKYIDKILTFNNYITCIKCYKSYKLNDNNKLIKKELPEHNIPNEKDIYNKIKCNNEKCIHGFNNDHYIGPKEIIFCYKCSRYKKFNKTVYFCEAVDENVIGYNTINKSTKFVFQDIQRYSDLFLTGLKENIDLRVNKNFLVNYYKKYIPDLKTHKSIINMPIRCYSLSVLFKEDKYKNIQDIIQNIGFDIKLMSLLEDQDFADFRKYIENKLDDFININSSDSESLKTIDDEININDNESLYSDDSYSCIQCGNYVPVKGIKCKGCC
jgi:hypothetical protein